MEDRVRVIETARSVCKFPEDYKRTEEVEKIETYVLKSPRTYCGPEATLRRLKSTPDEVSPKVEPQWQ